MHPLALWLISSSRLRERDTEDRLMRRQRNARQREVELERDGRWAAAMRRWAAQDEAARAESPTESPAEAPTVSVATASHRARRRYRVIPAPGRNQTRTNVSGS